MKIVAISKDNLSSVNDILIADNIKDSNKGVLMIYGLNKFNESKEYTYQLVGDDYKLYKWNY